MLYTVVDLNSVFDDNKRRFECVRSSNPYDYIRTGYYLDNASLFGGNNNVSFNCNFPGNTARNFLDITNK